jgi:Na+/H+ antiporter NhaC
LIAVGMALFFGRTLLALFAGIWAGAIALAWPSWGFVAPLRGLWDVFGVYLARELVDSFRLEILGFILALVALVGVVGRGGGLRGLVESALRVVRGPRSAQTLTSGLGLLLFFDDYANCVLVGNTMRPLTDRLRISREKLAYLVDSTAAPVAALSLLSTWIAFQVSVYSSQLPAVGISVSGYALFIESLPLRFYCVFALMLVFGVAISGRDFGPMARAEARARLRGELVRPGAHPLVDAAVSRIEPAPGVIPDWRVAALPLAVTMAVTGWRIFADGGGLAALGDGGLEGLGRVLLAGSGSGPIFGGALAGLACAVFLVGGQSARWGVAVGTLAAVVLGGGLLRGLVGFVGVGGLAMMLAARFAPASARPHLSTREILRAGVSSSGTLGFAFVLLLEAWMIGAVCQDLSTADYLVALLGDSLPPAWLPLLLFALAGLVAFATGSSWSTMSILLPNVVALAATLGESSPLGVQGMVALCISAVLEGSVFGDHCSPISDTTVLSSVASGSDHLDHVRTQAPYALVAAGVAVLCGYVPLLWLGGVSPATSFAAGAVLLAGLLYGVGRPAPPAPLSGGAG